MKFGKTLNDLVLELERRERVKKDYLVDTRNIHMDADANAAQLNVTNEKTGQTLVLGINEIAHNQIGTAIKIPAGYYDRMRSDNPELLAENVNSWFNKTPKVHMLRTLDGTTRAFLSDRYRRIDNFEIARNVLPIIADIPDARVESCEVTDERMYLKVVNPRLTTEVTPGDVVQSGILITNSEVGLGQVTIQPLVYRLVCTNGMVVNDAKTTRRHVGKRNEVGDDLTIYSNETLMVDDMALQLKIRDTVRSVVDHVRFDKVVELMRHAKNAKIVTTNIPELVELAGSDFGYTVQEGQGILNYLIRENDLSLYGLANATTRYAQDVNSYDRSTVLESVAYSLMGMTQAQWNKLNATEKAVA